ncbi:MAG: hypothetical protein IPK76_03585 [Lewinellaceae bacterium]|nr:hypothetical protein [Lewinellaceae bacterium]
MNTAIPRITALLLLIFPGLPAEAQITGGQHVFQFLTLSPSARITALGGMQITVQDDDVAFAATNPAALNPAMDGRLAFNHNFFFPTSSMATPLCDAHAQDQFYRSRRLAVHELRRYSANR